MATATRVEGVPVPPPVSIHLEMTEREAAALRVLLGAQFGQTSGLGAPEIALSLKGIYNQLYDTTGHVTNNMSSDVFRFEGGGFKVKEGATL